MNRAVRTTRVFAVANQKGGVGKTTTSVNLAASLAEAGKSVLLADLDPQGNATTGSGIQKREVKASVYQLLLELAAFDEVCLSTPYGYDLLPANRDLAGAEVELVDVERREFRLYNALSQVENRYDFIILDCPPALNMLTINGLIAANAVIIPMQCEFYALEGLTDLVGTLRRVRLHLNASLEIAGLLRTMYNPQSTLTQQVSSELETHFKDKVYRTVIPRNVRLAEAPSFGKPAVAFDRNSKGAQAYQQLAQEILTQYSKG